MLILSRRLDERIHFPTLGIGIQIVRIQGQTVRVGIDAPSSIPVVRGELAYEPREGDMPPLANLSHDLRGRLNTATIGLHVAQKQLESGLAADAEATLRDAIDTLSQLESKLRNDTAGKKNRPRALLVEDNPNEQKLLMSYLRLSGVDVEAVGDGVEALEYLQGHDRPDAVLLDMNMPRCDGPATLAAIRNQSKLDQMKVFVVSGTPPEQVQNSILVDAWFRKPVDPAAIVETVTRIIQAT